MQVLQRLAGFWRQQGEELLDEGAADGARLCAVGVALVDGACGQSVVFEEPGVGQAQVGGGLRRQVLVQPALRGGVGGAEGECAGGSEVAEVHGVSFLMVGLGKKRATVWVARLGLGGVRTVPARRRC